MIPPANLITESDCETDPVDNEQTVSGAKMALRKSASKRRAILAGEMGQHAAQAVAGHAQLLVRNMQAYESQMKPVIALYWPIRSELDPRPLLETLAEMGICTALPITPGSEKPTGKNQQGRPAETIEAVAGPLDFRLWKPGDALDHGPYNTAQPLASAEACRPGCIILPMLAYDNMGWRLGYGGGYYDRSLAMLRQDQAPLLAIGLAFAGQRVDAVPHGRYDQMLDAVLTEDGFSPLPIPPEE